VIGPEKPSLDDLAHFGVKGMKWGQRKAVTTSDIHDARARQASRGARVNDTATKLNLATKASDQKKFAKMYAQQLHELKNNPDTAVAARMTRGEKTVAIVLAGPFAAIPIASSAANSRAIEKRIAKSNQ